MTKQFKPGQITAYVEADIKEAKHKLGIHWRGLIIRGIKAATGTDESTILTLQQKIGSMADKINKDSVRIYKLENPKEEE